MQLLQSPCHVCNKNTPLRLFKQRDFSHTSTYESRITKESSCFKEWRIVYQSHHKIEIVTSTSTRVSWIIIHPPLQPDSVIFLSGRSTVFNRCWFKNQSLPLADISLWSDEMQISLVCQINQPRAKSSCIYGRCHDALRMQFFSPLSKPQPGWY